MSVKVSVGLSGEDEDRELLAEQRRLGPPRVQPDPDHDCAACPPGWPMRASGDDEAVEGGSAWAW